METYKKSGGTLITDGIVSVLAGLILLFLTGISQPLLVVLFALYAIGYGITQLIAARGERDFDKDTMPLRAIGIFSLVAGILLFFLINASLQTVILYIAAHAIITGGAEIIVSRAYRDEMRGNALFVTVGIIRVLFGVLLLLNLGMTLPTLVMSIGWYAIIIGPVLAFYGYAVATRESGWGRSVHR